MDLNITALNSDINETHAQEPKTPVATSRDGNAITAAITVSPQISSCSTCGDDQLLSTKERQETAYVYSLGCIEARFPSAAVEKEFAQAVGRVDTGGLTDQQAFHDALSKRENRYLARKICWIFTVQGMDTYILIPRDPFDLDLLVDAIRPASSPLDIDVVIGQRGPLAPPEVCNGLMLPLVIIDQIYSFDSQSLIKSIPKPEKMTTDKFAPVAQEIFHRIMLIADNAGSTDEHRSLNYLAMRYPAIYNIAAECHHREMSLTGVDVQLSQLSGTRKLEEVIFSYTNRKTDVTEKYFVRVDVTEEFPFITTKLSPYYDR